MKSAIFPDTFDKTCTEPTPVYRPYLAGNESRYVNNCLDSGWISSRGEFVSRFEVAFAEFVGVNEATSVANGTVAIHLALDALGIGPGDEVIVPTLTYIATVNTILQTGAKPVFVDSVEDTLQMDPVAVELAVTPQTKAIMAVHLYGHPCDLTSILAACRKYDLLLIEDCAEAFGTKWNGRHVGTFGHAATFSFFGNKTITTGEGGMVATCDPEIMRRCRRLKNQGVSSTREYWHDILAYNYRMTNIQAAIGLAQLEMAHEILALKAEVARAYRVGLVGLPLRTHEPKGDVTHSYWMCSAIVERPQDRDPLRMYLAEHGIETRPFFAQAHTMPHCRAEGEFPVSASLSARGINLPSYPGLGQEQISRICAAIRSFWR
ncbi:DegT/DnrJ/EryC1/StrS aminotransferase family protein [Mesorhizobium sp. M1C.F.Ca.ET.193.01.1.1]|uniref:DegT/DnrJ/EryC1/StrS family aminotransferase n=2 Tax=Mesorhizobium TaxID=68287 RepID=UPI000FD57967|nr:MULTISPECIES: DegT/DnrJ/EryC1/StrS aminotransferase family protein [unclassified Mesorhizobium]TGS93450.1 DegT/DnrJ/EryC1/StrS aminotransferase family protein [bacterium M00.F.Ca.ET.177.01.1.1]TGQ50736.1 DegT/DnrJ/EryC1/StrS aminotransferase family protein [Mesorhizobium sp. M1C.F.Ca.ET.210.01.1.1]TGQ65903.1 DegT/DnrJ/EryC1/StrS aminotransferase family protein [Mesorhizobium sp. M1C.F.Ca.ET.212.01.1.1]TGQ99907.1 DegT/DnrJ/EryC1/StrS aminotransferase family protein [Mesorhizobium sp. M1C.F.Ca